MPLTKGFKETVKERMERSPKFRRALLREAIECLLSGDVDTGKAIEIFTTECRPCLLPPTIPATRNGSMPQPGL